MYDEGSDRLQDTRYSDVTRPLQEVVFWRGLTDRAIAVLIRRGTGRLEWPVTLILSRVDAPEAVEFTVCQAAKIPGHWSYASAWEHSDFHGRRLSLASTKRLEDLWRAPGEAGVRAKAFHFWNIVIKEAGRNCIQSLRSVEPSEPFYREALRARIREGDRTAADELIHMTETAEYPHYWWQFAHRIWDEKLKDALDAFLGRLPEDGRGGQWEWEGYHFCAATVLIEIPVTDAEDLLVRHWHHLKYRSLFVQAALAVATPRCCDLVASVVKECPDPRRLFEHFHHHCGISSSRRSRFVPRLEALVPYLELFSDYTLESLWRYCNERRLYEFRKLLLDPRLSMEEKRRHCGLGREALWSNLDRYLGENWSPWSIDHEIQRSQKRGESWDYFLGIMLEWLQERGTLRAFEVVAHALVWAGRRTDLARLGEIAISAEPLDIRRIVDRTAFQISRRRLR